MDACTGAGGLAGGGGVGGGGAAIGGGGGGIAAGGGIIFSSLQAAKIRIKERLASFALVVGFIIFMHLRYAQDAPGDMRFLG
jgi:hypothetical protein